MCLPLHSISLVILIWGCKEISIAIPDEFGSRIIKDKMKKFDYLMHNQGGKFYRITMICQVLWVVLMLPNGLNPYDVSPILTMCGSNANSECFLSNDFHASSSVGCLNTPSFVCPSVCHVIWAIVCCNINNLCKRHINRNHRNTLMGRLLGRQDCPSIVTLILSFHFDNPHFVHKSKCSISFQNNIQSF
jgi:hypothetical protein